MNDRQGIAEQYTKDIDVLNFVSYRRPTGEGVDYVLQHKRMGTEMAHITLHPDGVVHFMVKNNQESYGTELKLAARSGLSGYSPAPSEKVKQFLNQVRSKV